jgi:hypothetical protein
VWALVDSGAQKSFVSQEWAKKHLRAAQEAPRLVTAVDGHQIKSYGSRDMELQLTDASGAMRNEDVTCEAVKIQGYVIILGYDWLQHANPDINWALGTWLWRSPSSQQKENTFIAFLSMPARYARRFVEEECLASYGASLGVIPSTLI